MAFDGSINVHVIFISKNDEVTKLKFYLLGIHVIELARRCHHVKLNLEMNLDDENHLVEINLIKSTT